MHDEWRVENLIFAPWRSGTPSLHFSKGPWGQCATVPRQCHSQGHSTIRSGTGTPRSQAGDALNLLSKDGRQSMAAGKVAIECRLSDSALRVHRASQLRQEYQVN